MQLHWGQRQALGIKQDTVTPETRKIKNWPGKCCFCYSCQNKKTLYWEGNWDGSTFAKTSGTVSREREKQLGSLCSHVFERRTSTGSEPFSLFKCLDATKSVWPNVFTLTETICPILFFKIKTQEYKKSTSGRRVSLKNVAAWTLTSTSMVTIPGVFAKADWSLLPSRF